MILSLLLGPAEQVSGLRHIPKSHKTTDVKHPEFLVTIEPKPTILIPGVGRFLLPPKCKKPFYPYNPVTGAPLTGFETPTPATGAGAGNNGQVPPVPLP
ncbi:hypothetical protein F2Q69_00062985 [Brassica cretica]|uniref:Uncharacterized protein n=1 Tax=Brassica cretica TaxID=69181 RepID=A0A8S9RA90_BRACR|nr:hypothetical protein F2Q69_00062985 [Brassica cretica]